MIYLKKVSTTKPVSGNIINSKNITDKEKNTYSANIIDKPWLFKIAARLFALDKKLKAGVTQARQWAPVDQAGYITALNGLRATLFNKDEALESLNKGKVMFFAGGTGHPYFSTDTGTTLRAIEIEADAILMAKNVDGIYSADPNTDPTAVKFDELTYDEVLARHLKATDSTAMTLAMDNHMTLVCFALKDPKNIIRVVRGEKIGTIVKED